MLARISIASHDYHLICMWLSHNHSSHKGLKRNPKNRTKGTWASESNWNLVPLGLSSHHFSLFFHFAAQCLIPTFISINCNVKSLSIFNLSYKVSSFTKSLTKQQLYSETYIIGNCLSPIFSQTSHGVVTVQRELAQNKLTLQALVLLIQAS